MQEWTDISWKQIKSVAAYIWWCAPHSNFRSRWALKFFKAFRETAVSTPRLCCIFDYTAVVQVSSVHPQMRYRSRDISSITKLLLTSINCCWTQTCRNCSVWVSTATWLAGIQLQCLREYCNFVLNLQRFPQESKVRYCNPAITEDNLSPENMYLLPGKSLKPFTEMLCRPVPISAWTVSWCPCDNSRSACRNWIHFFVIMKSTKTPWLHTAWHESLTSSLAMERYSVKLQTNYRPNQ
jgi:hypothetical protein